MIAAPERCVYGPVPSRRLGLSLGVDLVPYKVCCYDCVYCQVGATTDRTTRRRCFVEPHKIAEQVAEALQEGPAPEIITLAGSGEPTLYTDLTELEQALRRITSTPLALLTNGGLLWDPEVAAAASRFDLVAPSLDAADEATFQRINRPAAGLTFQKMLDGLRRFCGDYQGTLRLEVLLVAGVNDSPRSIKDLAHLAAELEVSFVDLNTVVRPPAHAAAGLDHDALERALACFEEVCTAEVVAPFRPRQVRGTVGRDGEEIMERVLRLLARRPCTLEDLCASLELDPAIALQCCVAAARSGEIRKDMRGEAVFYVALHPKP